METSHKSGCPAGTMKHEPAGLYVHVPFCSGKCFYCDFFSVTDLSGAAGWVGQVRREARLSAAMFGLFDTLYLGGGTPSLLSVDTLGRLIESLRLDLPFCPDTEITLEVNPEDVGPDRLSSYKAMGVNRISMGIQSLEDSALQFLGRRHSAQTALRALGHLLDAGFRSVSVDLIFGIPGQDPSRWTDTLSSVLALGPQHISCYELTVSSGTPLARLVSSGEVLMPDDDELASLYLTTVRMLEREGFLHYEVSNFALPGHESRHNQKYWRRIPYLGLGPGAHSFLHPLRWWNPGSLEEYGQQISSGRRPSSCRELLTPEQDVLERLWLGFRTLDGVDCSDLTLSADLEQLALRLERSGLLTRKGQRLVPTAKGFLVSDSLPTLFTD